MFGRASSHLGIAGKSRVDPYLADCFRLLESLYGFPLACIPAGKRQSDTISHARQPLSSLSFSNQRRRA
eukprot:319766-Rhodomonas_salina.8